MQQENSPVVSIISPVYNSEKYLSGFVESVLNQSFTNWELLLVDDGSTDNSESVCKSYSEIDGRVHFIKNNHNGVSFARNTGISISKGRWIYFADSDDLLMPDGLKTLWENAGEDVDLVSASYRRFIDGELEPETLTKEGGSFDSLSFLEEITRFPKVRWIERYLWTKLFRKDIIDHNQISFDEQLSYREDVLFLITYLSTSKLSLSLLKAKIFFILIKQSFKIFNI